MLPIVKASLPMVTKLADLNNSWLLEQESSNTLLKQASVASAKKEVSEQLVAEATKVGSMLLSNLKANSLKKLLKGKKVPKAVKKAEAINPLKALGYGTLAAVPLGLTANYMVDKASDEMDAKMYAIPGLAAATVGAILAMRNSSKIDDLSKAQELQNALKAKEVIDSVVKTSSYTKISHINTEHIANLISEILAR
tara:strand:- start:10164 stop:10751 length:588 start_codon:yes stop_codon:yes gene_type:complete